MNELVGCTLRSVKYSVITTYFVNVVCHVNASFKLLTAAWNDILPICDIYHMQRLISFAFLVCKNEFMERSTCSTYFEHSLCSFHLS